MAEVDRLKRQILRDLVQENVDLIEGNLVRRMRRRRQLRMVLRALLALLVPLGLFASTRLLARPGQPAATVAAGSGGILAPAVAATPAPGPASEGTAAPAAAELETASFNAPTPVDAEVFPLAVRRIAVDAGHGGDSLGTRAPRGLVEKELTLDIALRLNRLLRQQQFEVLMTRVEDKAVSLEERGRIANREGADIFVSIHLNWIENRRARGVETYYLGATDDPYLTRLAAEENRESGYSLGEMRKLLDRLYANVRQDRSRELAETVQTSLFSSLGRVNPQLENRGVKAAPFIVLLSTEMPAILAEVSCLSNEEEAELLKKPLYRQYIAEALAAGIRSYADAVEGKSRKPVTPDAVPPGDGEKGT